jgi:uncharacterized small protein (DUF1192 family)
MSLYRQAQERRGRRAAGLVALALLAGLVGYAIGRATAPDPSARDVVERVSDHLRPVGDGLGLIPGEYEQAYRGEGAEASGVNGALDRIESELKSASTDLRVLDPHGVERLEQRIAALRAAVKRRAAPAQVRTLADQAARQLQTLPGAD